MPRQSPPPLEPGESGDELARQRALLEALTPRDLSARDHVPFYFESAGKYVVLVLVACEAWEVPVCLQYGGWNDVPYPAELSAILRHWGSLYGGELIAIGDDYLEMRTTRRLEPNELKTLAWEQFIVSTDIVFQGTQTVDQLARGLAGGQWYFWWD